MGGADTGIRWTHNALKAHYRGWNGVIADHDFNWHDSIHSGGGICGPNSPAPCDDSGHGTHTIGTAIGDDGAGNQIGMAPQAQFIGCRNMNVGVVRLRLTRSASNCFSPPTRSRHPSQGDPTKRPISRLTRGSVRLRRLFADHAPGRSRGSAGRWHRMVVAAGNSGPSCSTVSDPPSLYDASYTVGALNTNTDTIASFSSRGPVTSDGSMRLKPDITAPGTNTRSAYNTSDTAYAFLSGTSMATPHIAGAVALLWSAHPELRNDDTATEAVLNDNAVHILSSSCDAALPRRPIIPMAMAASISWPRLTRAGVTLCFRRA